ncbi:hypothetical protein RDWZM_009470 [Blomia tropicalis]|uniref:snRNA-activating protein complex subunit 3 n=1 Tax=Blomia tropicalis TaxID=40697 RepID=A0A9Q0M1G6_BLOTA|nr:small nuclear RNA activating complex, polypeptide 3 [Blomia tropicalis]KAJ6218313.1 hypothetical protein RDWZM_009470 [Blomia tropicalis]
MNVTEFPFILKQKVSVSQFVQSWIEELSDDLTLTQESGNSNQVTRNANELNIPTQMVKSLESDLNPIAFCELVNDNKIFVSKSNLNISGFESETLKEVNIHNERFVSESKYRMSYKAKYRHDIVDQPINIGKVDTTQSPQAILTIQIYRPAIKQAQQRHKLQLDREIQVLSSQFLTTLRDSFVCISDVLSDHDYSDTPLNLLPSFTKHQRPGFFFIDGIIYDDTRCESMLAPKRIIQWAKEKEIGNFEEKSMVETRFESLSFHLGFPYLYMHGNNCEHLLVFTDLQMYIPNLNDPVSKYPKCTTMANIVKVKCQMCSMYFSKWFVFDNKRLPSSPFYFCYNCFLSFNYDEQNQKIGSFKAYPIVFNLNP